MIRAVASMRFEIRHRTSYRYSGPVCLDRHTLRVLPRCDARQRVVSAELDVDPAPSRCVDLVDAWGNPTSRIWFEGETERLEVDVRLEVETRSGALHAPPALPPTFEAELATLGPYLAPLAEDEVMAGFTAELARRSGGRVETLLDELNGRVHGFYAHGVRLEGPAREPAETLRLGEGVCRDLALLFVAACRYRRIPARFVSGYQDEPATAGRERRFLHAWAEAYLPGSGWRGYDPTRGSRVDDRHVAVACAPEPSAAAPIEGSFRFTGSAPSCALETDLRIAVRPSAV